MFLGREKGDFLAAAWKLGRLLAPTELLGGGFGGLGVSPRPGEGLGSGGGCLEGDCWVGVFFFLLSFLLVFKTGFSSLKAHSTGNG